jgi:hypothetical protein
MPSLFFIFVSLEHIFFQIKCQNGSGSLEAGSFLYWFLFGVASKKKRKVGYESASMEFIVDMFFGDFNFMEMNHGYSHSKFLLDKFFLKTSTIMLLCNIAPCLIYSYGFFVLFESSPDLKIRSLKILCTEYLVGMNLLDKTWTFQNSVFLNCMWNTLSHN